MGLIAGLKNLFSGSGSRAVTQYRMVTDQGNGFYSWGGQVYYSDIVRACLAPKAKAVGKLTAKHIRNSYGEGSADIQVNPEPYIRFLLEEPNPYMSMQKLLEKAANQLSLNRNAFIIIIRDENGLPAELFPAPAASAEAVYIAGELHLRFTFENGSVFTFPYSDVIHLRTDFFDNDLFGSPIIQTLQPLMEVVSTADQGIVKAIRSSGVVRWLLKFTRSLRPEDLKDEAKKFSENFLSVQEGTGVAAVDAKVDAQEVNAKSYVPESSQLKETTNRIYSLFNTNESIVQSHFTEDEYNAYYEAEIEPVAIDLAAEFTRKLFTRKERSFGNRIVFEAMNLTTASMRTKLALTQLFDRGIMNRNEIRHVLNYASIPGGDKYYIRLDTAEVKDGEGGENE